MRRRGRALKRRYGGRMPGAREIDALLRAQDAPTTPAPSRTHRELIEESRIERMLREIKEAERYR